MNSGLDAESHCCEQMRTSTEDDEIPIIYVPKFREYGVRVLDGGSSYITLNFCPWCGRQLPQSLRDKWFEEIASLGLEPGDKSLPHAFASDQWWRALGC